MDDPNNGGGSDNFDAKLLEKYAFPQEVVHHDHVGKDVSDKLQLCSDSIKKLFRVAERVCADAKETTNTVSAELREGTFKDYADVDRPSHLVRKLAEKTPDKGTSASSGSKTQSPKRSPSRRSNLSRRSPNGRRSEDVTTHLIASAREKASSVLR